MHSHTLLSIISLLAVAHGQEYDYGGCTNTAGDTGSCIELAACSNAGGTAERLLCPGPTEIQCCSGITSAEEGVGEPCELPGGMAGVCDLTSLCAGTSTPGYCGGGVDVQCCTTEAPEPEPPGPSIGRPCTVRNVSGTCSLAKKCTGTSVPGFCPGGTDIECCITAPDFDPTKPGPGETCDTGNAVGVCTSTSICTGTSTPGYCTGGTNIQCCTPTTTTTTTTDSLPDLNASQSNYARIIASLAPSPRGCEVAIATAMQESVLRVLANTGIAESYGYAHDGVGSDHDSVGIFQQRPSFWGNVKDCMDPVESAKKFFAALNAVSGWEGMGIAEAAQSVQRSEFPDAYVKWEEFARGVCAAM